MNMNERVQELRELRRMREELAAEIEAIESEVKAEIERPKCGHTDGDRLAHYMEECDEQPSGHSSPETGAARAGRAFHPSDDGAPLRRGVKGGGKDALSD